MTRHSIRSESGFTLIEMLISTAIFVTVTGAIFAVFNPSHGIFQAQPEVADEQQRLRVGVDSLRKDLMMAGAGMYSGSAVGALGAFFAPIIPARLGTTGADPPGTVRADAITLVYVPTTPAQTTIKDPMPNSSAEIKVNAEPGCPSGDPLCGFAVGMRLIIFDDTGSSDVFTVTNVQDSALHLQHRDDRFSKPYGSGAYIAQVSSHTYYYDSTNLQLRHYDGYQTDLPLVDNVVGLSFEYYGDPLPPVLRKPVTDPKGPWTTYGPKPPAIGVDNSYDSWPAGENCVFMVSGPNQVSRTGMTTLGSASGPLVPLTTAMLTDGPWCPDANSLNRFDADLLRVRKIRINLRVQTGVDQLRGPGSSAATALFRRSGTSKGGYRYVPDQEVHFDVTPRNLNLGR
jgi:prepilin-type N-terminal cleavage/methylation domain-containing protein